MPGAGDEMRGAGDWGLGVGEGLGTGGRSRICRRVEYTRNALELVDIVSRRSLESRDALRAALDECIGLGFRFTEDDFDIDRDFDGVTPTECMQDKFPHELACMAVPLKLEVNRAQARLGIDGCGTVKVSASRSGMALLTYLREDGTTCGPLELNYRMVPPDWIIDQERQRLLHEQKQLAARRAPIDRNAPYRHIPMMERPLIKGMIPDDYGRLPGDNGYNTCYPPGQDPFSVMQNVNIAAYLHGGSGAQH